jgi:VWFA-related protein
MKRRPYTLAVASAVLALLQLTTAAGLPAQTPQQQPPPPTPTPAVPPDAPADDDDDVVRITANLVQFDAVVTDKQGRLVNDLRPEDFEVLVDGRPQTVTNFSFVLTDAGAPPAPAPRAEGAAGPLPAAALRPGQVGRTIALVVDDLGTSFDSLIYVRRALKKFVDEQMQPGDLVAIMQTGRSTGALQQFTTDRQLLHRAIERVRWNPIGRSDPSAFKPIEPDDKGNLREELSGPAAGNDNETEGLDRDPRDLLAELRTEIFVGGTLGALDYIVKGMRELPGRKSVVMFSDGVQAYVQGDQVESSRISEKLRRLADSANRASVVIYTMDPRGLPTLQLTAADNLMPTMGGASATRDQGEFAALTASRSYDFYESQAGLKRLARDTGGLFIGNTNDLGGGLRRVLDDQKGYYLIGFRPDERVFDSAGGRPHYNKFEVKIKRAGLNVRSRSGFYGYKEGETPRHALSRVEQLQAAIASPLSYGDIGLRLTSLFNSPRGAKVPIVDSLLHIDMGQLQFRDEGGWKKAVLDVVALTYDEDGRVVDLVNRTETVRARDDVYRDILANGLVYAVKVPVRKPGAYQLRVAVRDAASEKVGAAGQFLIVPDVAKGRLGLSGIFASLITRPAGATPLRDAAVRRFRQGSHVQFQYHIYNATVDRASGRTHLRTRVRLFRDGVEVLAGVPGEFDPAGQKDLSHLLAASSLRIGTSLEPGAYVLQVLVTDELAKGKGRTATQWIDFEVVR